MKVEEINHYIEAAKICARIAPILQELIAKDEVGMVGSVMAMLLNGLAKGIEGDWEHKKSFVDRIYRAAIELCDADASKEKESH